MSEPAAEPTAGRDAESATAATERGQMEPAAVGSAVRAPHPAPEPAPDAFSRLNQPWRGVVAVVEVVLAIALGYAAVWSWRQGIVTVDFPSGRPGQPPQGVTRYFGNWIGGAIALAVLAGFVVMDAIRQAVLAVRGRGQGGSPESG